jgi:hypothetical protein
LNESEKPDETEVFSLNALCYVFFYLTQLGTLPVVFMSFDCLVALALPLKLLVQSESVSELYEIKHVVPEIMFVLQVQLAAFVLHVKLRKSLEAYDATSVHSASNLFFRLKYPIKKVDQADHHAQTKDIVEIENQGYFKGLLEVRSIRYFKGE